MIPILYLYSDTYGLLILRAVLGIILIVHGWKKVKDLKGTAAFLGGAGFKPAGFWAFAVGYLEFLGGILLVLGLLTQYVSFLVAIQFVTILVWKLKGKQPFMGGVEFDLLILAVTIALFTIGAGSLSLDHNLFGGVY